MLRKKKIIKHLILIQVVFIVITVLIINFKFHRVASRISTAIPVTNKVAPDKEVIKIDWTNQTFIQYELTRSGPGEHGEPVTLDNNTEIDLAKALIHEYSYNVIVSEKISLDRSLQDVRYEECLSYKYRSDLPAVSVIIIFRNEHHSVLKRTVHSIINRTPSKLLNEIILVDDCSSKEFLGDIFEQYMKDNFKDKVKILRLKKQHGLMKARMHGIKHSISDIVIVMDGHMEVNVNWLPPLIEPIVKNNKTMTQPSVDYIDWDTFKYIMDPRYPGHRGAFNWQLSYVHLNRVLKDGEKASYNYPVPVILGAVFAINKHYFWKIGGYDKGLQIWGGEQFELSWKVWMCGGKIKAIPCSHVGHNFKGGGFHPFAGNYSYVYPNLKRIIEVWTDEYKDIFYSRTDIKVFDAGNISKEQALRKSLKCKSFKWYIKNVVPDIFEAYPIDMSKMRAYGVIQSDADSNLCVDRADASNVKPLVLYNCDSNLTNPRWTQYFLYTIQNEIRLSLTDDCWDIVEGDPVKEVLLIKLYVCHKQKGRQEFFYVEESKQIKSSTNYCLEANLNDTSKNNLFFNVCDNTKVNQRWSFGKVNLDVLRSDSIIQPW